MLSNMCYSVISNDPSDIKKPLPRIPTNSTIVNRVYHPAVDEMEFVDNAYYNTQKLSLSYEHSNNKPFYHQGYKSPHSLDPSCLPYRFNEYYAYGMPAFTETVPVVNNMEQEMLPTVSYDMNHLYTSVNSHYSPHIYPDIVSRDPIRIQSIGPMHGHHYASHMEKPYEPPKEGTDIDLMLQHPLRPSKNRIPPINTSVRNDTLDTSTADTFAINTSMTSYYVGQDTNYLNQPISQDDSLESICFYPDRPCSSTKFYSPCSPRIPSPWGTSKSNTKYIPLPSTIEKSTLDQHTQVPNEKPDSTQETIAALEALNETFDPPSQDFYNEYAIRYDEKDKYSLSIASSSLVNIRSNTKLYRRMAVKTHNKEIQMTYANYLLQISKLYEPHDKYHKDTVSTSQSNAIPPHKLSSIQTNSEKYDTENHRKQESPREIRYRLLAEAGYWIERLAKAGVPEALYIKGKWYLLGNTAHDCVLKGYDKVQENKAFKCFLSASKAGWLDAHYELAHLWKKKGNYKKALKYYEKGAEGDHSLSIYKLAKIYLRGQLQVKKNLEKGLAYLKKVSDMNTICSAEPSFVLGCILANEFERIGVLNPKPSDLLEKTVNFKSAMECLHKSALYGYPDALYFLGHIFETGLLDQPIDIWKSYTYYTKAAEKNHAGAMLDLSRMYSEGLPGLIAPQKDMAFKWCKRSADYGFEQAEYVLG
ncbi:hypothetical protein BDB01DRAFT_812595 [Pilobolus umbonatus]|nr:hypothetical protein BDB01DRAFT_812595 [Pilobolus umbonatus]